MENEEFYYRPGECQFEETLRLSVITHIQGEEEEGRYRRVSEREKSVVNRRKNDKISQSMFYMLYAFAYMSYID